MDGIDDVALSARRVQAPIDTQIIALNTRVDNMEKTLQRVEAGQGIILERLTEIQTDRKLVMAAAAAAIIVSSLAFITSIIAVIAAFTIR